MAPKLRSRVLRAVLPAAALALSHAADAAQFFAGPEGSPANAGTRESPWDIAAALSGGARVAPGDTVFLLAGTYRRRPQEQYEVKLAGTAAAPIHVKPAPGERATIDGGLAVMEPSAHLWVWDLEIIVSENFTLSREIAEGGSSPASYGRPWGGLNVHGGRDLKFVHLTIHHCAQGISAWSGARDVEMYGCVIYENGWKAPDRGHGHCIYTQNQDGTKTIRHCIMAATFEGSYTIHAYGSSRAYVDNFVVDENICYDVGPFLIGGGRPSRGIRAAGNVLYGVPLRIGYSAPYNEDCLARDNTIVNGSLEIKGFKTVVEEGTRLIRAGDPRPAANEFRWFPSAYDPRRAHLAVFNWQRLATALVPAAPFLAAGDRFRVLSPKDPYGQPVAAGAYDGTDIAIPMSGEFGPFIVWKETRP